MGKQKKTLERFKKNKESIKERVNQIWRNKKDYSIPGICKPMQKLSDEEYEKRIKDSEERRFSPHFMIGGRHGNTLIPFEEGIQ